MKEIYRTTSLEEAQVFCSLLRDHELEPVLDGEQSGLVALGLYTTAAPLIVFVADEHEARAKEVIDALIRERHGETVFESSTEIPPSTPEEDASFQDFARRTRVGSRKRWLIAAVLMFWPIPIVLVAALAGGDEALGHSVLVAGVPFLAAAGIILFLARRARKPTT